MMPATLLVVVSLVASAWANSEPFIDPFIQFSDQCTLRRDEALAGNMTDPITLAVFDCVINNKSCNGDTPIKDGIKEEKNPFDGFIVDYFAETKGHGRVELHRANCTPRAMSLIGPALFFTEESSTDQESQTSTTKSEETSSVEPTRFSEYTKACEPRKKELEEASKNSSYKASAREKFLLHLYDCLLRTSKQQCITMKMNDGTVNVTVLLPAREKATGLFERENCKLLDFKAVGGGVFVDPKSPPNTTNSTGKDESKELSADYKKECSARLKEFEAAAKNSSKNPSTQKYLPLLHSCILDANKPNCTISRENGHVVVYIRISGVAGAQGLFDSANCNLKSLATTEPEEIVDQANGASTTKSTEEAESVDPKLLSNYSEACEARRKELEESSKNSSSLFALTRTNKYLPLMLDCLLGTGKHKCRVGAANNLITVAVHLQDGESADGTFNADNCTLIKWIAKGPPAFLDPRKRPTTRSPGKGESAKPSSSNSLKACEEFRNSLEPRHNRTRMLLDCLLGTNRKNCTVGRLTDQSLAVVEISLEMGERFEGTFLLENCTQVGGSAVGPVDEFIVDLNLTLPFDEASIKKHQPFTYKDPGVNTFPIADMQFVLRALAVCIGKPSSGNDQEEPYFCADYLTRRLRKDCFIFDEPEKQLISSRTRSEKGPMFTYDQITYHASNCSVANKTTWRLERGPLPEEAPLPEQAPTKPPLSAVFMEGCDDQMKKLEALDNSTQVEHHKQILGCVISTYLRSCKFAVQPPTTKPFLEAPGSLFVTRSLPNGETINAQLHLDNCKLIELGGNGAETTIQRPDIPPYLSQEELADAITKNQPGRPIADMKKLTGDLGICFAMQNQKKDPKEEPYPCFDPLTLRLRADCHIFDEPEKRLFSSRTRVPLTAFQFEQITYHDFNCSVVNRTSWQEPMDIGPEYEGTHPPAADAGNTGTLTAAEMAHRARCAKVLAQGKAKALSDYEYPLKEPTLLVQVSLIKKLAPATFAPFAYQGFNLKLWDDCYRLLIDKNHGKVVAPDNSWADWPWK